MKTNALKSWLGQVSQIQHHYQKLAAVTGENFNIFKILKVESLEVRMHTNLLAELLNPEGSHGQNDLYLLLFVEHVGITNFDTKTALLEVEKHIGKIDGDYTQGGFIDICITDNKHHQIYIENKIYAKDQKNQLLRYFNSNKDANLFYLTLGGSNPTEESTGNILSDDSYTCISYKNDILEWLHRCRKESVNIPIIRETITQYISLINILTNQSKNNSMNKEIRQFVIKNPELIDDIELCHAEIESIRNETKKIFFDKLNKALPKKEVISLCGYTITLKLSEDSGGVYFGYKAIDDGSAIKNDGKIKEYRILLKEIDDRFRSNNDWLGWIIPTHFIPNKKFSDLKIDVILNYYADPKNLDLIVDEIVEQEANIRKEFLSRVS